MKFKIFLYVYFHQIEGVEFICDSHGQTFLSTLYTHASMHVHVSSATFRSVSFVQQSGQSELKCQKINGDGRVSQFETLDRGVSTRETSADVLRRVQSRCTVYWKHNRRRRYGRQQRAPPRQVATSDRGDFISAFAATARTTRSSGKAETLRERIRFGTFSLHILLLINSFLSLN